MWASHIIACLALHALSPHAHVYAEANGEHQVVQPRQGDGGSNSIAISNRCADTVYPGIVTQSGTGTQDTGFELTPGSNHTIYVSSDWVGRVWGRTNCSFNDQGQGQNGGPGCSTGDCGQLVCKQAGNPPATLAEFTLNGGSHQTFYDISLVDGYNLPLAIVMLPGNNSQLQSISPSTTNPSCVGSVGDLAPPNFNPYGGNQQFLGTNASSPLAFENTVSLSTVSKWCPWDLQVEPPSSPGDGVYPYPDGNILRPAFDPCLSACAKYNTPSYCCTGSYDGPQKCGPNYYSKAAKNVCPDAYSYAYDDQYSTFIIPSGANFEVIFCPGGRSTNIIASRSSSSASNGRKFALRAREPLIVGTLWAGFWVMVSLV